MMRNLVLFLVVLPFFSFGQVSDTSCISARWISLKNDEFNRGIFGQDSVSVESIEMVSVIRRLVEAKKLNLYSSSGAPGEKSQMSIFSHLDIVTWYNNEIDSASQYDPFFEIAIESDYPLVDEYGEPIIVELPDGTQAFKYPPPTITRYTSGDCDEIRIKEKKTIGLKSNHVTFEPVAICFVVQGKEIFWIDLKEFWSALDPKSSFTWKDKISNKEYVGFQYMQRSCYD